MRNNKYGQKHSETLVDTDTLRKWIECSFNGNVLILKSLPAEQIKQRWNKTAAIDKLVNNKQELMRRLHKVAYSELFDYSFETNKIDSILNQLSVEERLRLVDHVLDYVYVDFKSLTAQDKPVELSEELRQRQNERKQAQIKKREVFGLRKTSEKPQGSILKPKKSRNEAVNMTGEGADEMSDFKIEDLNDS